MKQNGKLCHGEALTLAPLAWQKFMQLYINRNITCAALVKKEELSKVRKDHWKKLEMKNILHNYNMSSSVSKSFSRRKFRMAAIQP